MSDVLCLTGLWLVLGVNGVSFWCQSVSVLVTVGVSLVSDRVRTEVCVWPCPCQCRCLSVSVCDSVGVTVVVVRFSANSWKFMKIMKFIDFPRNTVNLIYFSIIRDPEGVHGTPPWSGTVPPPPLPGYHHPLYRKAEYRSLCHGGVTVVTSGSPGFFWLQRVPSKHAHFWHHKNQ